MIELKEKFEIKKYRMAFHQLYKDNELVIYRVESENSVWYEVFRYRTMPPDRFHDDEWEYYPGDEAWSCSNLDVVRKVISHPERGHFGYGKEDTDRIIAKITVR